MGYRSQVVTMARTLISEVKGLRLDLEDCALARLSKRKVDPGQSTSDPGCG